MKEFIVKQRCVLIREYVVIAKTKKEARQKFNDNKHMSVNDEVVHLNNTQILDSISSVEEIKSN